MALLLAMYQKMRLVREKNQVTLDLTKYSSKLDRVTKTIERVQKRYTSLFTQLESQAKMAQTQATMMFQNMAGLGGNCTTLYNYSGMNGFTNGLMQKWLCGDGIPIEKDGAPISLTESEYQDLMTAYGTGNLKKNEDGTYGDGKFDENKVKAFTLAQSQAAQAQQQAQMWVQNSTQAYGNNVSIWLEAARAQLEAEQDAALEPLNYQETMWELEKTQADNKLKRINAQIESYDQLVSSESEKSAPSFGLR